MAAFFARYSLFGRYSEATCASMQQISQFAKGYGYKIQCPDEHTRQRKIRRKSVRLNAPMTASAMV